MKYIITQEQFDALNVYAGAASGPTSRLVQDILCSLKPIEPLTEEQKQALWAEAYKDTPQNPGWRRHLRYAEMLEAAHNIKEQK